MEEELDQKPINLSSVQLTEKQSEVLAKGSSYVPLPRQIDYHEMLVAFDKLCNHLRFRWFKAQKKDDEVCINDDGEEYIPKKKKRTHVSATNAAELEVFIKRLRDAFVSSTPQNFKETVAKLERSVDEDHKVLAQLLKEMSTVIAVQDKRSRFVVVNKQDYVDGCKTTIKNSNMKKLTVKTEEKVLKEIAVKVDAFLLEHKDAIH